MAKWADYLISGIWFTQIGNSKYVSHVMVHVDNGDTISTPGKKWTKDEAIAAIKNGKSFCTIRWNYNDAAWNIGAAVEYERVGGVEYLRTRKDASSADNLDNLLRMTTFGL